jgi:phage-related protein
VKIFEAIEKMQIVPTAFLKKLKGGCELWEIRIHAFRFIGFYDGSQKLVLVHAFDKQSMKTPKHEIEVAVLRMKAYLGAKGLL